MGLTFENGMVKYNRNEGYLSGNKIFRKFHYKKDFLDFCFFCSGLKRGIICS